jgi:glycosyltransferase involved in cell wall biosynthesis
VEIAFFTDSYLPTRDGVASETSALARALTRLGHGVTVFAPGTVKGAPSGREEVDGIPVERLRAVPVPLYGEYQWALFPFLRLRPHRFRERVDLVHLHTPGIVGSTGFLAARHYRKPLVGTFHTNVWAMRGSFAGGPLVRLFFRAAWWYSLGTYYRCDVATAPSDEARRVLESASRKPFRHPVEVIPNGIEIDRFRPGVARPDWRERCGLRPGPLVTYLGRLTADKGVHRFLDAIAELDAAEPLSAIVGGAGPEEPSVRQRIHDDPRLEGRVRYVGAVAEEEKAALLGQSDLFVLPSISDTSSLALLEAMACGVACIASDQGGPRELLRDGVTGRLVPVQREGALAESIQSLLVDPSTRHRLAAAGRDYVQSYASIESTARRFISLYGLLMDGGIAGASRHDRPA